MFVEHSFLIKHCMYCALVEGGKNYEDIQPALKTL